MARDTNEARLCTTRYGSAGARAPLIDSFWTGALPYRGEAIKTGFLLSQGGEFAFVLLSLAKELRILPDELNRLLIIVVHTSTHTAQPLAVAGSAQLPCVADVRCSGRVLC